MKKLNLKYLVLATMIFGLVSCSKKLDKFPANAIELSQSFKTLKDAKTWNSGLYSNLRGRLYGSNMFIQDVMGDQLNATLDFGNRNGSPHRWVDFLAADGALSGPWAGYYSSITNINIAIAGFSNIATSTAAEKTELDRYKGDAYLARAYYYSQLILRFAKPYEPATATTEPGVPLVLEYDIYLKPARATIQQVYGQILSDINNAKTLLSTVAGVQGSSKFTTHCASALEARVKLNMQDWSGAKAAADAVITAGTYPLITTATELKAMWTTDLTKEVIFQSFVSKPNELANTNSIYLGFVAGNGKFTPDFVPSQWVVDMYDNADLRKAVYFERKLVLIQGFDYPNVWLVNKYPGNPALFTGATTNYQHAPKLFRVAELYLISAEAGAREGAASEAAALTRLNQLRVARGLPSLVGVTGATLTQAIRDERFRELAFEGFRLFDLKRWHLGFARSAPQNTAFINIGANYESLSIAADAQKFVWGIPTNDITINPNLTQNTGW